MLLSRRLVKAVLAGGGARAFAGSACSARLPDGRSFRVLFAGGFDGERILASSEIYDAATTLSSPGPPLLFPRRRHTAIRPAGVDNVLIFGDTRGSSARTHVRPTAGAELFMPALNQFFSPSEFAAADANGKPPAHIETHVTLAELDWEGDLRDVRFYLLTPDKAAANTEVK